MRWLMSAPRARYQIEERIGSGAYGTVYRAKMVTTGGLEKLVALKILRQDRSTRFNIDRLQHEARLLAMLRHRAIVRVIDLVHLPQGWTLVLEYVEGLDFAEIARLVTLPPRAALEVVGEVAAALHAGWTTKSDNGPLEFVHQDIKLANIILTAEGTVKLLDLGIASSAALDLPADPGTEAMIHGTIRYMAPERFENVAGPASDIYSLGVVLSELLGQRVSGRPDNRGSMEQGVRLLRHSAGQAVATLFERMVSTDPRERPTALEVSRVCRQLQSTTAGATLADWAMDIVPELTEERTAGPDDEDPLIGQTLTSVTGVSPVRSAGLPVAVLALALTAVLLLFGAVAVTGSASLWLGTQISVPELSVAHLAPLAISSEATCATLSSDGSTLVYNVGTEVFAKPFGGVPTRVAVDARPFSCPAVSPDGSQVAYATLRHLRIVDTNGMGVREIAVAEVNPQDWGSEGLLLLRPGVDAEVLLVEPDGATARSIGHGPWLTALRWRADGKRILVTSRGAMWWMDRSGVLENTGINARTADVVDGGRVLFAESDGHGSRLFLWREGERPVLQTQVEGRVRRILASESGDRAILVVDKTETRTALHRMDFGLGTVESSTLLAIPRRTEHVGLSADGEQLVRLELLQNPAIGVRGAYLLHSAVLTTLEGDSVVELASFTSLSLRLMNTSPDRERQYFLQVRPDGSSRVGWFSLKEPGPSATLLEVDPKWVWFGVVSPDATQLVALDESFRSCLYSMQVPMTTRSELCAAEGWVARGWLDDARVLVVRGGEIGVLDVDSLEVTSHGEADVRLTIEAGDDSVVLLGNEKVSWLDLVSGHKHVLFPVSKGFRVDGADLHRDAGRLIVGENRDSCEFWMAELRWEGR